MIYANDRLAEIYGVPPSELDGNRWLDRVEAASQAPLVAAARSVAEGGGPAAIDVRLMDGSGARWARLNLAAVSGAGLDGMGSFVGTVEDVTAEVEARAELLTREAEYRVLAEHSGDCLSRHDTRSPYFTHGPSGTDIAELARVGERPQGLAERGERPVARLLAEDAHCRAGRRASGRARAGSSPASGGGSRPASR